MPPWQESNECWTSVTNVLRHYTMVGQIYIQNWENSKKELCAFIGTLLEGVKQHSLETYAFNID